MKLIETHCHLDYLKAFPLEEILDKAWQSGVEKIITIAVEPANLETALAMATTHENVYCTQGVHPHDSVKITDEDLVTVEKNAANPKVVAIGEIGLDYHYNNSPQDIQRSMFERQLDIASRINLPVVIHTRDADEDTLAILKNYSGKLKKKGVIHSYTSGKALAEYALSEGFKLGFNGIITFPKADNVREVLALTPITQILFETDAPFLTPVPHRGKENGPYFLLHVAQKICELKKITEDVLYPQVYRNTQELFFSK